MPFAYDFSDKLKSIVRKLRVKDPHRTDIIYKKVNEIINSDETSIQHYKFLKHDRKHEQRVHIDKSFVLTFTYSREKKFILFLDFDHHDNIYR